MSVLFTYILFYPLIFSFVTEASVVLHSEIWNFENQSPNWCPVSSHSGTQLSVIHNAPEICEKPSEDFSPWQSGNISTWTQVPLCTQDSTTSREQFCIYTSASFAGGRGISILTTPSIATYFSSLPVFKTTTFSHPPNGVANPPPFEIKSIPGKGLGVIANRTIYRGERLFASTAVGIFHNSAFLTRRSRGYAMHARLMKVGVDALPVASKKLFYGMAMQEKKGNEKIDEVIGRLNVNTFGEDFGGEEHSLAVPETARLNHDCRPNAMYYFDHRTLVHYTSAVRTIYAGEEITITYIDPLQSREDRQEATKRSWGFECTCSHCSHAADLSRESDNRLKVVHKLEEQLSSNQTLPEGSQEMAAYLVSLYEQERLDAHIADAWRLAAKVYQRMGRKWEALRWANKALEGFIVNEGPRSAQVVEIRMLIREVSEGV